MLKTRYNWFPLEKKDSTMLKKKLFLTICLFIVEIRYLFFIRLVY